MASQNSDPYELKIPRAERDRIAAHCRPYGITDEVFAWFRRLAAMEAGLTPSKPTSSGSFTELLTSMLVDLEGAAADFEKLDELSPRKALRDQVADCYYWMTRLRPPRVVRVSEELFPLLDGDAGFESIQLVCEVDRPNRLLIIRRALKLRGPPPTDDER
jgi:hypothetical protein